jgi:hypothetical protein
VHAVLDRHGLVSRGASDIEEIYTLMDRVLANIRRNGG